MGACLCKGDDDFTDVCGRGEPSRKRSVFGNRSTFVGGSNHSAPVPDFGVGSLYRVMELLGEGGTGQTWLCQDLRSHMRVAIKFIPRPLAKVLVPMVSQEIQLQAQLSEGHVGLVRVESALLSKSHLGLVMEYVDGGTLTQYVTKRSANKSERGGLHLTEDEARYFFRQLLSAVEYLHVSHVAHRDLKMCNVVLTQRRPPTLKLCDFGFAKGWDDSSVMHTRIGTPVYMSPQLIASKTDGKAYSATAADVWACGVMLFAMLLGRFPYDHVGHPDPNSSGAHFEVWNEQMKVSNGDWQAAPRVAPHVNLLSEECKDLLGKMLDTDEAKRITIPEIRNHVWFTSDLPPYLEDTLRDVESRQARLSKVMEAASEAQIKRRNKAVHDLIVMAGHPHNAEAPYQKRVASGAISAIFEGGTEGDAVSVGSTGHGGANQSRALSNPASLPSSPDDAAEGKSRSPEGGLLQPQLSAVTPLTPPPQPAASSIDGGSSDHEVLVIELAAVAKRTRSDGLVLLSTFCPDASDVAGGSNRNCNCGSEASEPPLESDSGTGGSGKPAAAAAPYSYGGGGGSTSAAAPGEDKDAPAGGDGCAETSKAPEAEAGLSASPPMEGEQAKSETAGPQATEEVQEQQLSLEHEGR